MLFPLPESQDTTTQSWPETPRAKLDQLRDSALRIQALEHISRAYYNVLLATVQRRAPHLTREDVKDLMHDFYEKVVFQNGADKSTLYDIYFSKIGRLRRFLDVCLKNFMKTWFRHKNAEKRGSDSEHVILKDDEPDKANTPDPQFGRDWAMKVIEIALTELDLQFCTSEKKQKIFKLLKPELFVTDKEKSDVLAKELGITPVNVRAIRSRFSKLWKKCLRKTVAATVLKKEDIDSELKYVCKVLTEAQTCDASMHT